MSQQSFRWSSLERRSGGLFQRSSRVVGKGEYRSLTFHEIESRSLINRVPESSRVPFQYTINPYRGCSHACTYCFARPTHEYLGFDIGTDFDSQIVVKTNAVALARAETAPGRWAGDRIAMGTNTDPYQKAEGKYRLTRGIAGVLTERRNPFSILTKSTLALRDLDLFVEAAAVTEISVDFSIATLDEDVWRETEPGTPHPRQRLAAVKRLNEAGVPSGVLAAPLLPSLSDGADQVAEVMNAAEEAGATFVTPMLLYLTPPMKRHWMAWLRRHRPELVARYAELYRNRSRLQPVSITPRNDWEKREETSRPSQSTTEQLGLFDLET
jgi:DNA repair photolyase